MDNNKDLLTLAGRQKVEVSDIFRNFGYLLEALPSDHTKVVRDITNCRTSVLGGHKLECKSCGHLEYSFNSCRNRHCPKCQFLAQKRWVNERMNELLPVSYFHIVFTIPHELRAFALCNKRVMYKILFKTASETLKEVGEKRLKAKIGFTTVLHTWGQNLVDHPHLHFIVPGGGPSLDEKKWIESGRNYFLPIKILSIVFRAKFLKELEKQYRHLNKDSYKLQIYNNKSEFKQLLFDLAKKQWVVYAKKPFSGPKQVLNYLGNYTHRIAISNYRIIKTKGDSVYFTYKDYKNGGERKILRLHAKEFMRRFLLHVLPRKFVRMRHYGFLSSRNKTKTLNRCRMLLNLRKIEKTKKVEWKELLENLTGIRVDQCSSCKLGTMQIIEVLPCQLEKWKNSS